MQNQLVTVVRPRRGPFRTTARLLQYLGLDPADAPYALARANRFPMLVPADFAARMRPGDWQDPLLLQVLPRAEESRARPGFSRDPVCDSAAMAVPGLLHKYHGRVLVLASGGCAVHCRYCFRRAFPFARTLPGTRQHRTLWRYVRSHPEVTEVILSGGDPLTLSPARIERLLAPAYGIAHLRTLRIHTRVPVADPGRVTPAMLALMRRLSRRFTVVVVVQANCAEELRGRCVAALQRVRAAGALLLNQSVLLAGVNDSVDALERLSRRLPACGVIPYYLHQLDRAQGTWHFEVDARRGRQLIAELRRRLPGYLVPRYVREIPGQPSKATV